MVRPGNPDEKAYSVVHPKRHLGRTVTPPSGSTRHPDPRLGMRSQLADLLLSDEQAAAEMTLSVILSRIPEGHRPPEEDLRASVQRGIGVIGAWLRTSDPKPMYSLALETARRRSEQGLDLQYLLRGTRAFRDGINTVIRTRAVPGTDIAMFTELSNEWTDMVTDAFVGTKFETVEVPVPEWTTDPSIGAQSSLRGGTLYHVGDLVTAEETLKRFVGWGRAALVVTPERPERLRTRTGLADVAALWLTNNRVPEERTIAPTSVVPLMSTLSMFLEKAGRGIVLLDGLDFLIGRNTFPRIHGFVQVLHEKVLLTDAVVLVPFRPSAVTSSDFLLLMSEMTPLPQTA